MARYKSEYLPQGALIEMMRQGGYVKVSAIDPVTGIEVSIVGDPAVGADTMKLHAYRKLDRMVERHYREQEKNNRRQPDIPSGWDL